MQRISFKEHLWSQVYLTKNMLFLLCLWLEKCHRRSMFKKGQCLKHSKEINSNKKSCNNCKIHAKDMKKVTLVIVCKTNWHVRFNFLRNNGRIDFSWTFHPQKRASGRKKKKQKNNFNIVNWKTFINLDWVW